MSREFVKITSIDALLEHLKTPDTAILCGGTDLIVKMKSDLIDPKILLDISDLEPLRKIREEDGRLFIGAAVIESELLNAPLIRRHLPLLAEVLSKLGSVQIRNRGTLGGNLVNASPAADSAIPLLLYNAAVVLQSTSGERSLTVEEFFLGPGKTVLEKGEFLREIVVPVPLEHYTSFFHKVGRRKALTIAIASVGALLRMSDGVVKEARLAAGSVAPTPIRLHRVEERITGQSLTPDLIEESRALTAESVLPITDVRASADYRRAVTVDLVAAFLEGATGA